MHRLRRLLAACPVRNFRSRPPPFQPSEPLGRGRGRLDAILARYRDDPGPLMPVLQDINRRARYLPRLVLEHLACGWRCRWPRSSAWPASTTLSAWSRWAGTSIEVCVGTACFVPRLGAAAGAAGKELGIAAGETDRAGGFTLRTVRCIGCCALAPAMRIDGVTFGKVKLDQVVNILEQFA